MTVSIFSGHCLCARLCWHLIYVSSVFTIAYQRVNIIPNSYVRELQLRKMKQLGQRYIANRYRGSELELRSSERPPLFERPVRVLMVTGASGQFSFTKYDPWPLLELCSIMTQLLLKAAVNSLKAFQSYICFYLFEFQMVLCL